MAGPSRPQFVLFGSSIVELSFQASNGGFGAILADLYYRQADIVLRGYGGWNSRRGVQILDQVFPKDGAVQPSLVIVYFGGNDSVDPHPSGLGPHVPLPDYIENMKKIGTHLKGLSENIRIIFLGVPPCNDEQIRKNEANGRKSGRNNESCRIYSEACLKVSRELGIKAIDLWHEVQERENWLNTCFTDGIHFTSEGNQIVAKEILKVLREADWEPSLYHSKMPIEFGQDSPFDAVSADGKTTVNTSKRPTSQILQWELSDDIENEQSS
ncbi:GDSL esterase/lipase WDL1 [Ziziphus jujuba]|uniref:GDSL esterase/lipase WDL1 n=1 Tax=Ziziphus jujuba TaxID=326968 RepID=A0ABM3I3Y5_ZIZJJ|nr:GDSL esterase/lipase WDL1 [Ziziphus jujuba]